MKVRGCRLFHAKGELIVGFTGDPDHQLAAQAAREEALPASDQFAGTWNPFLSDFGHRDAPRHNSRGHQATNTLSCRHLGDWPSDLCDYD